LQPQALVHATTASLEYVSESTMHELALEPQPSPPTLAWAPFGLTACMTLAEEQLGGSKWVPREDQRPFVDDVFPSARSVLGRVPRTWIRSLASTDAAAINAFLRKYGSGHVQLEPFADPGALLFAAVTRVQARWAVSGTRSTLCVPDGRSFVAAKLDHAFTLLSTSGIETLVKLECDERCSAYLVPWQPEFRELIRDEVSLVRTCRKLQADLRPTRPRWGSVLFPMVEMQFRPDLRWLRGLSLKRRLLRSPLVVSNAVQELGFRMNHIGASFRDEVVAVCLGTPGDLPPFVIDRPFLLWIAHERLDGMPLFAAVLSEDAWKDPGDALD